MNVERRIFVSFTDLPIELVGAVVSEVASIGDLLRCRAVNHTLCEFATPRAFLTFHAANTLESTRGLQSLLESERLAPLVKHLVVHCEAGPGENRLLNRDEEDDESKAVRKCLSRSLSRLHRLTSLTKLEVNFFSGMVWQSFDNAEDGSMTVTNPSKYFMLQTSLIHALASPESGYTAPVLSTFNMHNLIPFPSPEYQSEAFATMLSGTQHLSLTVHGLRFTARRGEDMWSWFWSEMVPERFLEPTQSSLTSLKLMSDQPIGHFPTIDLAWLRFPLLTDLTVSGIMLNEQCLVEDFIVNHAASLHTVTLDTCPIHIGGTDGAPIRPWSVVYQRFADRLTNLLEFRTQRRTGWGLHEEDARVDMESPYERCITGYGYERGKDVKLPFEVSQADRIALRNLLRVVNNRRRVRRLSALPMPDLLVPPGRVRV